MRALAEQTRGPEFKAQHPWKKLEFQFCEGTEMGGGRGKGALLVASLLASGSRRQCLKQMRRCVFTAAWNSEFTTGRTSAGKTEAGQL